MVGINQVVARTLGNPLVLVFLFLQCLDALTTSVGLAVGAVELNHVGAQWFGVVGANLGPASLKVMGALLLLGRPRPHSTALAAGAPALAAAGGHQRLLHAGGAEQPAHRRGAVVGATQPVGRAKANVLPLPTSLSTQMRPRWASTMSRLMYSPRPSPSCWRRWSSAR